MVFAGVWRSVDRAGGLERRWRSIPEKRNERQIIPRLSDKASKICLSLYLAEIICNICIYIYACICQRAYVTWGGQ